MTNLIHLTNLQNRHLGNGENHQGMFCQPPLPQCC